jgi:hypothetical protein
LFFLQTLSRLQEKAHLLRYAANLNAQPIYTYASRFGFYDASHLNLFEQSTKVVSHSAQFIDLLAGTKNTSFPVRKRFYQIFGFKIIF